ncbi:glycosyltransferase family 4 protein [Brevibacillus humidisoli]|uniref:glycosyltransferase family 4 protein n=1 Tax=Brevibacillus humidisoli TaxID=2895522 RepID=UPI001E6076F6|nr:glycosyltransferase family 4 protein [Brevibacillus humidisoli]UFJ42439.1 glycosyltransferase family 4 protein [Brevibacillus humidisoli]
MNVLMLIHSQHPSVAGADNMAWQTARWLMRNHGVSITLVYVSQSVSEIKEARDGGLHTITLPDNETDWRLPLVENRFQIIHLFDFSDRSFLRWAIQLKQESGLPLVLTPATDRSFWECELSAISACRMADHLFVLTEAEREQILQLAAVPPVRLTLLPNAPFLPEKTTDDFRQRHGVPDDAPLVLFLGRKLPSKGYQLILQASASIWRHDPRVRFALIGSDTAESQAFLAQYRDERRVLALPQVSEAEKGAALAACDLLCLPSLADVFPLVFLEAWAYGKPVIASRMAGAEDVVRQGIDGLIVDANQAAVAEGVVTLLRDKSLRRRMGENGKERVARCHSWENVSQQVAAIYKQVVGGQR